MKKVMVFFLLLLVACMGFAEPPYVETLNVTLTIAEIPVEVAFTADPYTTPSDSPLKMKQTLVDLGEIKESGMNEESFWASAKTNSATHLTMKIYGTALTRKTADDPPEYTSEIIPLKLLISEDPKAKNSSDQKDTAKFDQAYSADSTWSNYNLGLTLVEGATLNSGETGKAGLGTRALTWNLKVSPTVEPGKTLTAGSYESYIWLVVGSNSTGA